MRSIFRLSCIGLVMLAGCGDSTGASDYEDVSGTFSGEISSVAQGYTLEADFSLTLNQSQAGIGGTWVMDGTVSDDAGPIAIGGTGTINGTIAKGDNPAVHLTILASGCPDYRANFAGTFNPADSRLTLFGPVDFFGTSSCAVALRFQTTVVMTR